MSLGTYSRSTKCLTTGTWLSKISRNWITSNSRAKTTLSSQATSLIWMTMMIQTMRFFKSSGMIAQSASLLQLSKRSPSITEKLDIPSCLTRKTQLISLKTSAWTIRPVVMAHTPTEYGSEVSRNSSQGGRWSRGSSMMISPGKKCHENLQGVGWRESIIAWQNWETKKTIAQWISRFHSTVDSEGSRLKAATVGQCPKRISPSIPFRRATRNCDLERATTRLQCQG